MKLISELYKKHKIYFWLLFPLISMIILLSFLKDIIFSLIASDAHNSIRKTESKDKELATQQDKAEARADTIKDYTDKLEKEINNIKEDEDWHKKKKRL